MERADIVIIGGGITGLTAAYLLRNSGKRIVLLEKETVGSGSTAASTGFLMEAPDTRATELIESYGEADARRIIASHRDAIETIEHICIKEKLSCHFKRCPASMYSEKEKEADDLVREETALKKLGTQARFEKAPKLPFSTRGALIIENQAKFDPAGYTEGLAALCAAAGVLIREHEEVAAFRATGEEIAVRTVANEQISTDQVLVATHYPLPYQPFKIFFKKAWYTTYVLEARIPRKCLPEGLYEDSQIPYYYFRVDQGKYEDRLLFGGEDHRSDVLFDPDTQFAFLEAHLRKLLPHTSFDVKNKWSGRIVEPGDGLAYIGPIGDARIYYATAFSGTGLTYGTIAAQLFAEYTQGKRTPLHDLYAADRSFDPRDHAPKAAEYLYEFGHEMEKRITNNP
jgi:glycine/D-amino acid oxidase-like deaminating enzyme